MSWRENEAFERFIQATLTVKELYGQARFIDLLEQELHRELAVRKYAETSRALVTATTAAQQSSEHLDTAVKALEFYADSENHRSVNGKPSPVARDKGRRARAALEAISGETADEGEGGEGEE